MLGLKSSSGEKRGGTPIGELGEQPQNKKPRMAPGLFFGPQPVSAPVGYNPIANVFLNQERQIKAYQHEINELKRKLAERTAECEVLGSLIAERVIKTEVFESTAPPPSPAGGEEDYGAFASLPDTDMDSLRAFKT